MALSAAVLTGGASRRMGADKAMLDFDGQPLLARTLATLRCVADDVLIVGAQPAYAGFGATLVADDWPGLGTLGGLATALRIARYDETLVVACDMPLLSVALLRALAAEPRNYDVLLPVVDTRHCADGNGQPQPLHAIYARRCLPAFVAQLEAGRLTVIAALEGVEVRRVNDNWLQRFDPQLRSFLNVNTQEQLADARRLLGMKASVEDGD